VVDLYSLSIACNSVADLYKRSIFSCNQYALSNQYVLSITLHTTVLGKLIKIGEQVGVRVSVEWIFDNFPTFDIVAKVRGGNIEKDTHTQTLKLTIYYSDFKLCNAITFIECCEVMINSTTLFQLKTRIWKDIGEFDEKKHKNVQVCQ